MCSTMFTAELFCHRQNLKTTRNAPLLHIWWETLCFTIAIYTVKYLGVTLNYTNGKTCMIRTLYLLRKKFKTSENGKISYSLGEVETT